MVVIRSLMIFSGRQYGCNELSEEIFMEAYGCDEVFEDFFIQTIWL